VSAGGDAEEAGGGEDGAQGELLGLGFEGDAEAEVDGRRGVDHAGLLSGEERSLAWRRTRLRGLEAVVKRLPAGTLHLVRFRRRHPDLEARAVGAVSYRRLADRWPEWDRGLGSRGADADPAPAVPAPDPGLDGLAQADLPATAWRRRRWSRRPSE